METLIGSANGANPAKTDNLATDNLVIDSSISTFQKDVLEASLEVPVLVDFWAPWCGPCKTLGPMLEKLVREARGAVRMVKINVDQNQMLAQQLQIQSIPTVIVFKGGRPIDGFQGALPESQLKQFITALAGDVGPTPTEQLLEAGEQALAAGDPQQAAQFFAALLEAEPANAKAIGRLALIQTQLGDVEAAKATLATAPADATDQADIVAARAALALAEETRHAGDPAQYRAALDQDENDHQARFDLALALTKIGDFDAAATALLDIVRRDRAWNDDGARKQLVKMFDAFGHSSPFTLANRRKLSSVLFS